MKTTFKQEQPPKEFIPITISFTIESERELRAWNIFSNEVSPTGLARLINGANGNRLKDRFIDSEILMMFPSIPKLETLSEKG